MIQLCTWVIKNTDNTDRTSDTQGENQSYSVDVSQLGGMYGWKNPFSG